MATIVDDITTVLTESSRQMVVSAINYNAESEQKPSIFNMIDWMDTDNPKGIEEQIEVSSNSSVGTFAKGGAYNAAGRSVLVDFELDFARYHFTIDATMTDLRKLEVAGPARQDKIADFLQLQFSRGAVALRSKMETDVIQNTPSLDANGFVGLEHIGSGSNSYGGVSATTYSNTGALVTTVGGALTLGAIDTLANTFTDTNGGTFDMCLTSQTQLQKFEDLAPASNNVGSPYMVTSTGLDGVRRTFSAGFVSHYYRGRPVIALQDYPTDAFDLVNSRAMAGRALRQFETRMFDKTEHDRVRWAVIAELVFVLHNRRKNFARLDGLT